MEANIIVTRHDIYMDKCFYTFQWDGPENGTAYIQKRYYDRYRELIPWKLKVIEFNFNRNSYLVARQDGINFISSMVHWIKATLKRKLFSFKMKVILTCIIWNHGYIPEGEVLSWKHIRKRK